ncbi:MAG TPA: non-homologous end-joining DNA ligase [Candidatus Dormibacteraeota bacterium]|nr:non-homologous end-joining DNA ligase [Candidatus Dormibacteraeota bacterium]
MAEQTTRGRTAAAIPTDVDDATVEVDGRRVALTNLRKVYFPKLGLTKGDLLRYYLSVAGVLLPHVANRPMVMKRYPHGVAGDFFYMKRTPSPRPPWLRTCTIEHRSGNVIDFPVIDDRASLLWMINLGCIDLNPWYSLCDDPDRPLYLHFDLDPTPETPFSVVSESALIVGDVLRGLRMTPFVKTTGSKGVHIYVAIRSGPTQHEVWEISKEIGHQIARAHPDVLTAEYRIAKRPKRHVLVDYNQNAWGKTLASIYSVRANEAATVSTPIEWSELEAGCELGDFTIFNVPERVARLGDLWKPLLSSRGRFNLAV